MERQFYVHFLQWQSCVRLWHEILLKRRVATMRVDSDEWMMTIPCVGLDREPAEDELASLGMLINQWAKWDGVHGVCAAESGAVVRRRKRKPRVEMRRITQRLYRMGDLFCVKGSDILIFESKAHMDLYCTAYLYCLDQALFNPLCSVLEVVRIARSSETRLAYYTGEEACQRMGSVDFWLPMVRILWPRAESLTLNQWESERFDGTISIESMVHSLVVDDTVIFTEADPVILVQRDADGRHSLCMMVILRPSRYAEESGTALLVSYVGYHSRKRESAFSMASAYGVAYTA
jgi:hypothetical protein